MLPNYQPIIQTHYLTPYKIVLLILIMKFCRFDFPSHVIPRMVVFLLDSIQENKEAHTEPELDDMFKVIVTFDEPPLGRALVEDIDFQLHEIRNPDNIHQFMIALIDVVEDGEYESDLPERTAVDRTSVFGMFVRRCRLEYLRSTFHEKANLFAIFRAYITGTASDKQLERITQPNASLGGATEPQPSSDPLHLDGCLNVGGWQSDYHINHFLTSQAEMIDKTGTSNISPVLLHNYLSFLQKHAPDMGKLYQVRFLNYVRTGEYEGALTNLHRFFDYCLLNREIPMYQYALLNLGILNVKFGHIFQAASALTEALHIASENEDEECLNEVVSWLRYIRGMKADSHEFSTVYTASDENADFGNVVYLQSLDKLSQARDMLRRGDPVPLVFERLYKSSIQSDTADVGYLSQPQNLVKSYLWRFYGNSVLSNAFLRMALHANEGTADDMEKTCVSVAEMHLAAGEYKKSDEVLKEFSRSHPHLSAMSLPWKQSKAKVDQRLHVTQKMKHMGGDQAGQLAFANTQDLAQYHDALYELAMTTYEQDDPDNARIILEQSYMALKKTDHVPQLARNLNARAQLHLDQRDSKEAIRLLQESFSITQKSHDAQNHYAAAIKLAEACLGLEKTEEIDHAVRLLEYILPKVLLLGSIELQSDVYLAYSKALTSKALLEDSAERLAGFTTSLIYAKKAEEGYRQLGKTADLRKACYFQAILHDQLHQAKERDAVLDEIKTMVTAHSH